MSSLNGRRDEEGRCLDIRPGNVAAIILAGGINEVELYEGYEPGYKALIPFRGRPSIQFTLEALQNSKYVGDICVVGAEEELREAVSDSSVSFTEAGENLLGSVMSGLEFFKDRNLVLGAAADIPLISAAGIDTFLEECAEAPTTFPSNLWMSGVPEDAFVGPFAASKKALNRFRDVTICHGNVWLMQPSVLDNAVANERLNAMYAARKSAIRSALALGLGVGLAYVLGVHLLHLLTIGQMARLASRRFNVGIVPVLVPLPEFGIDVDEPADYELVRRVMEGGSPANRTI